MPAGEGPRLVDVGGADHHDAAGTDAYARTHRHEHAHADACAEGRHASSWHFPLRMSVHMKHGAYRSELGIADGMSTARVWTRRYSK